MKILSLLVIGGLLAVGCRPAPEEILQYYGSGELSRRHTQVEGKKEGRMTEYYPGGEIKSIREFENDIQVGKSTFFYPDGSIQEVQYYDQGKMHGGDTVFYPNGSPQFLRTYSHGLLDGYIRKWDSTGVVIYEARYANDVLVEVKGQAIQTDSIVQTNIDTLPRDTSVRH